MHGLFKNAGRIAAAGALGLATLATTGAAQAQGWHYGWRHYSGPTVVVRCDWRGTHCRRVVVYDNSRYGYGYGYREGYRHYRGHHGYRYNDGYGPYDHRPHSW